MKERLADIAARLGVRIDYRPVVVSTNDLARDPSLGHGDVVVAEEQTAGRGQKGNRWASEPGRNLTFSVVLTPDFLPAGEQFALLQAVSLAVADTLDDEGIEAQIKWPNDIYADGRKIAGLLIENDVCGNNLSRSIVGIGLNVNQVSFPPELPNPTSAALYTSREHDRATLLEAFCSHLAERFRLLAQGETDVLARDYHARLFRLGAQHRFRTPGGDPFPGTILDVGEGGELLIESPGGKVSSFLFKEVEFLDL